MLSVLLVTDALRKANSFPSQTFLAEPVVERVWDEDIFPTVLILKLRLYCLKRNSFFSHKSLHFILKQS